MNMYLEKSRKEVLSVSASRLRQGIAGFTIIEAIISIAIMVLIGIGIITFQKSVIVNTKVVQSELNSQQQTRKTLNAFAADVRSAAASSAGAYAIATTSTSTFSFYANVDADASIERVRYFLATTTLKKGIIKPGPAPAYNYVTASETISILVNDIANATSTPIFTYYDTGYDGYTTSSTDPLPSPVDISAVRLVKMTLTVNPNGVRSPVMQTYTTQATIRNLKDNL